jgi:hypothetical protein
VNLPVEVVDALKADRLLVFVGSHATREVVMEADGDYPEAAELARELGWRRPRDVPGGKARGIVPSVEEGAAIAGRERALAVLRGRTGAGGVSPGPVQRALVARFPTLFTTCQDDMLERAAQLPVDVVYRGEPVPEPDATRRTIVKLRGGFERPERTLVTAQDRAAQALPSEVKKQLRGLIRNHVVLFVGYRPDEEEFERLFGDLSEAWGGELPRCHLAVAQGRIDDYLWQKWVWRGLLLFLADPSEVVQGMGLA